jgi:hypothetical protein
MRKYSDVQLRALLKRRIDASTQRAVAGELGISPAFLCDLMKERRDPGPTVLQALGLRRVVTYEQV